MDVEKMCECMDVVGSRLGSRQPFDIYVCLDMSPCMCTYMPLMWVRKHWDSTYSVECKCICMYVCALRNDYDDGVSDDWGDNPPFPGRLGEGERCILYTPATLHR